MPCWQAVWKRFFLQQNLYDLVKSFTFGVSVSSCLKTIYYHLPAFVGGGGGVVWLKAGLKALAHLPKAAELYWPPPKPVSCVHVARYLCPPPGADTSSEAVVPKAKKDNSVKARSLKSKCVCLGLHKWSNFAFPENYYCFSETESALEYWFEHFA